MLFVLLAQSITDLCLEGKGSFLKINSESDPLRHLREVAALHLIYYEEKDAKYPLLIKKVFSPDVHSRDRGNAIPRYG